MSTETEANKDVVQRLLRALAEGRLDDAVSFAAPDCLWWVLGQGEFDVETMKGRFWSRWASPSAAIPGTDGLTIISMTAEDDRVAVELKGDIRLPDGREYRNAYFMLFTFADGRLTRVREYFDTAYVQNTFASP